MSLKNTLDRIRSRYILESLTEEDTIRLEIDLEEGRYDEWFELCRDHQDSISELFHRAVFLNAKPDVGLFIRQGASLRFDYALEEGKSGNILFVCLENDRIELFKTCLYLDKELLKGIRSDGANLLEAMLERVEEPRDIPSFEEGVFVLSGFVNPKKYFTVRKSFLPRVIDPQFRLYTEIVRDVRKV